MRMRVMPNLDKVWSKGRFMGVEQFVGRTEQHQDVVWPLLVRGLAAALDVAAPPAELPPLWHWLLFQEWAPASRVARDGHPQRGGFLPAAPELPRRMWAGGRLKFNRALRIGDPVTRDSTILKIADKAGSSGRLLFVTVGHQIRDAEGVAIVEEQDIVYREQPTGAVPVDPTAEALAGAVREIVAINSTLLFRYSALTGNGHRIHYDHVYARQEEGYNSLVVHGPLQATLLGNFAQRQRPGKTMTEFSFRGRRPALLDHCPLVMEGVAQAATMMLRTVDAAGYTCTSAEARFSA